MPPVEKFSHQTFLKLSLLFGILLIGVFFKPAKQTAQLPLDSATQPLATDPDTTQSLSVPASIPALQHLIK